MKTITYIITIALSLTFTNIFAGHGEDPAVVSSTGKIENPSLIDLAPSLPATAPFDELAPDEATVTSFMIWALAPVTPKEADFYEEAKEEIIQIHYLAPSLPTEAGFNDNL